MRLFNLIALKLTSIGTSKALNATIHPMISFFLNLEQERIITRYCHMNPMVSKSKLKEILSHKSKYFLWGGADLFNVTTAGGKRQMVIIENNSCPSGTKIYAFSQ